MSEGRPLAAKLGIREGAAVAVLRAPDHVPALLAPLPEGARVVTRARGAFDVIVLFATRRAELARRFPPLAARLTPAGGLWVAYPKKASGLAADLDFARVQEVGLEAGLVDNKSCAIDEVWTAVRFVLRMDDRAAR